MSHVIRDMRIPVYVLVELVARDMPSDEVLHACFDRDAYASRTAVCGYAGFRKETILAVQELGDGD